MLTPKEAYDLCKKKFPDTTRTDIADFGEFYTFTPAIKGDMVDEDYKVNKETGEIEPFWFDEYASFMQKQDDDYTPKVYDFKEEIG